jgi:UDP-N-acetylglucosamine enolpyruvyl transferase
LRGAEVVRPQPSVGATENLLLAAVLATGTTVIRNAAREPEVADLAQCLVTMGVGVWTDVGELMLLVFTQDGVSTWEVNLSAKAGSSRDDLIASGTADTFEAAKAAALFEARVQSSE